MKKTNCALLPLFLIFCGCATTITNLTPSTQKRNADGLYPVEVVLDTHQQSLVKESIAPYVIVDTNIYPMQPTMMLNNRWEALVPVPANRDVVNYRYKFDYDYRSIPRRQPGSKLSPPYQLRIIDK